MKSIVLLILGLFTIGAIFSHAAFAKLGVGVGLGKVSIDKALIPGGIYKLPSLPVLNTGDEPATYQVTVTYLQDQKEFAPPVEWFKFNPQKFPLAAGGSQTVEVSLSLPVNARPGNYFAFLEAAPVTKAEGVTVGIAAATKLNFTVKPAGILGAAVERIRSIFENNAPFSYIIVAVLGGGVILAGITSLIGKYFAVQVIRKSKKEKKKPT